jgi:hypothetical protein
LIQK